MNGFIARTARSACLLGGLLGLIGCMHYRDVVDPCYPERYNSMARKETKEAFAPQLQNGEVLDQTIWDSYFRVGSAELTPGGMEKLNYIIRRRPCPDMNVFVQNAQILPTDFANPTKQMVFDPDHPEKMIEARNKLNQDRKDVVQKYLATASNGRGLVFNVDLIDVATPQIAGVIASNGPQRLRWLSTPAGNVPFTGGGQPTFQVFGNTTAWP